MQSIFTNFEDKNELLTEAQKIQLLLLKVQSPILNQDNNSLQVSYYIDQYKATMFDFIANSMSYEAANLPLSFPNLQASEA